MGVVAARPRGSRQWRGSCGEEEGSGQDRAGAGEGGEAKRRSTSYRRLRDETRRDDEQGDDEEGGVGFLSFGYRPRLSGARRGARHTPRGGLLGFGFWWGPA